MAIPTPIIRNLEQSGILREMVIGLSDLPEDQAVIIDIIRNKQYSDKPLALIREYSTNAVDSHVEAGIDNVPIKVTLPTQIFPELRIRDYGLGLTPDEVDTTYIKYGRSRKRRTNGQTGQFGIGSKSAFCYGDNFIVVSYKDGVKTTYNLTINDVCATVAAEPMDNEDKNGIEVIIPVKQNDVHIFQDKAVNFFKYWKVCPELKGGDIEKIDTLRNELAVKPLFAEDDWEIRPQQGYSYSSDRGIAVMGNIPYPINWDIVSSKINLRNDDKDYVLYEFIRSNKTIFRFNIGDLDFSASRESLEYTDKTCNTIVNKTRSILDSIFNILNDKIKSAATYWDALMVYNQIFGRDDEKIFQGDVFRLEKYYKGKFKWNDIVIECGAFEHIERWDTVLGYREKDVEDGCNPVLTTYENKMGRIKQHKSNSFSNNRIPASKKICIIIHDLEKPVLTRASVRYMFHADPLKNPNKIYFLRFKDKVQMADFIEKTHFESAPVIYVSDIQDKVKNWLKQGRVSNGNSSNVRDPQSVRCFAPTNHVDKYGYIRSECWKKETIDIREEEGFFANFKDGKVEICGNLIENISYASCYINTLLTALGENVELIYALPERNRNAKWFKEALEDDQWINIETYLQGKKEQILHGKGVILAKAAKYFKNISTNIGIDFAENILPLLTNEDGAMYKACVEISSEFKKLKELSDALHYFKMDEGLSDDCSTDFEKLFEEVRKTYPMLQHIKNAELLTSNNRKIPNDLLQAISQYVNTIDSQQNNQK